MDLETDPKTKRQRDIDRSYRLRNAHKTGEYIDEFTTVTDNRTTEEILSQLPACLRRDKNGKIVLRKESNVPSARITGQIISQMIPLLKDKSKRRTRNKCLKYHDIKDTG